MPETSKDAEADYYSCSACGHAWTVNKLNPSDVTHITPLPLGPTPET